MPAKAATQATTTEPAGAPMPRFTREQLEAFRGATVPDLYGEEVRLLVVGINPGLWTAATGTHFCHPTNRFYPALREAGLVDWAIDPGVGLTEVQRRDLVDRGIGITNLVSRATARAGELERSELQAGADRLSTLSFELAPSVIAIAGVTAYRAAFGRPQAVLGEQAERVGDARLWVIPNPSGLNAHVTTTGMARWLSQVADVAHLG